MKARPRLAYVLAALSLARAVLAADASSLKPPPGAKVAIVVFEDLQCGDSARAYPVWVQAASAHHVPVMLYAFPLPMHNWAFDAAVWARFFDLQSEKLGSQFREYIYANLTKITYPNLPQFVQRFGDENKVPIPSTHDPDGKLAKKVQSDFARGQQIGLMHTPTVFVVGQNGVSSPLVETVGRDELNQLIEDMLKRADAEVPSKRVTRKNTH